MPAVNGLGLGYEVSGCYENHSHKGCFPEVGGLLWVCRGCGFTAPRHLWRRGLRSPRTQKAAAPRVLRLLK